MMKWKELDEPNSCLNKAKEDELIFVILERDLAAPAAIRAWTRQRIALGKNKRGDDQIKEALELARAIEVKQLAR